MASISNENGRRIVQFKGPDGRRRSIRLGKVSQRQAETVRAKVDDLAAALLTGSAPRPSTAEWVASIGDELHEKLAKVGLVEARASRHASKLGPFTAEYIASRSDVKHRTKINLERAAAMLVGFFGAQRAVASITQDDAEAYRLHLHGKGYSDNTVRRLCGRARQFFRVAMRRKLLAIEPFIDIPCSVGSDASRFRFITREEIERVLAACPDVEWRAIFALSRFGGLRCTSEHLALRWDDIDWEHNRMTVRSPKTEHHAGKASRPVPLFPELRPYLLELFAECEPGTEYVINRYRDREANLRTQANRIIKRAGLEPWPKTFHNLRATRQTELCDRFPEHVVCAWIGNSRQVAVKHYLHVTDEHWQRATAGEALQNPVQHSAAASGMAMQGVTEPNQQVVSVQELAEACISVRALKIPPEGLEPSTR